MGEFSDAYPENWSAERREDYKKAWLAGEPVVQPTAEHEGDACGYCRELRKLQREAEEEDEPTEVRAENYCHDFDVVEDDAGVPVKIFCPHCNKTWRVVAEET
jgi:hypothetical protein